MIDALLGHLSARFVFVVGKGGVGKSTCAAALALAMADRGRATHLLSTDPAHSIGDLFGLSLPTGESVRSDCSPRLTLEELDAIGRADRWVKGVRAAVAYLVDRGTYLDADDVHSLLDRALPGMDEVMGALRIVELAASGEGELTVIDTAPTGHTLRLLDCGSVLDGWVRALGAMADKAGAVALGLTGRRIRFEGEVVIEELRADVERFRKGVLPQSDFVVVTRDGDVVVAETRRLLDELGRRGHRVAALLHVGGGSGLDAGPVPLLRVPWGGDLVGCAGLRRWGTASVSPRAPIDALAAPWGQGCPLELIPPRPLTLFVGKGGVGKSTCAAAYALSLGAEHDILLLSSDPAGSLGDVLGRPVGPTEISIAARVAVRQLDADAELRGFRDRHRHQVRAVFERLGLESSAELDRRVLESIIDMAPPGVDEIFAIDAILDALDEGRLLVIDTAPTGHFLRLLSMPDTALSWARALIRILLKYRAVLSLDEVASDLLPFARSLERLIGLLGDPERAAAVVVTLDEALPRKETDRLVAALRARGTHVAAVLRNRSGESQVRAATGDGQAPPEISAAEIDPPPVGPERLLDFAAGWTRA